MNYETGDLLQGVHQGQLRYGEVIDHTERHYIVRWADGFRNFCRQGWEYGDTCEPAEDKAAALFAVQEGRKRMGLGEYVPADQTELNLEWGEP